jgi:hypothetical protein
MGMGTGPRTSEEAYSPQAPEATLPPGMPGTGLGEPGETKPLAGPVKVFDEFLQESQTEAKAKPHEFTGKGIEHLSAALVAVADDHQLKDETFEARTESMESAEKIKDEEHASLHANLAREALLTAAQLMETLGSQPGVAGDTKVREFRTAVQAVTDGEPLLNQTEDVNKAFNLANQALLEMATGPETITDDRMGGG